jgi:hypothetical protein
MTVSENLPHYSLRGLQPSFSEFLEYRRMATCFSAIAAVTGGDATLTGEGQPEDVDAKRVTSAAFPMIGIKALDTGPETAYALDWKRILGFDSLLVAIGECRQTREAGKTAFVTGCP